MIEILQFYVSGFWVWAGLTAGLTIGRVFSAGIVTVIFTGRR